eukprot:16431650-Heterocapsa_arctica.AAC.1
MSASSSVTLSVAPLRLPVFVRPRLMTPRHVFESIRMSPHRRPHISPVRRKQWNPMRRTTHKSVRPESRAMPQSPNAICSLHGGARAGISSFPHTPRRFHERIRLRLV